MQLASIEAAPARRSRRSASSRAPTTRGDALVTSTPARAAPTPRTGPRWCCGWSCAGPRSAASTPSCSRRARARRPASSPPPSASPARTPTASTAPRRAFTGSCGSRRSTRRAAARRASPGVEVAPVVEDDGRDRDLRRRPPGRHLPRERRRRPARQQDRLRRAHHAPPDGHRRPVPERALAVLQQGDGDGDAAREARRARRARAPGGDRPREGGGPGRQLRLADPLLRAAPLHARQGPADELRDRRRAARARRRPRPVRARLPALEARGERARRQLVERRARRGRRRRAT